ncbi:hypothetical protein MNBD_GAMMA25-2048 [hydrothermal vent metagenome]|uniref:Response regulatory domain-containing protein n=1 Tax=hydrothermal vent metagenome TaxID=652676 RepID=A0A3B1BFR6_9ZZZZ
MTKKYLTPNEVAEMLMVSPVTVRQWAQKGWLKASTTVGGHRRFILHDVEEFARERNLTLLTEDNAITRILIVDDDEPLAKFLVELLSEPDNSLQIEVAYDGFDAGRKVQTFNPDIILLDLMMSGMSGFDVCHQLKNDPVYKSIRVIAMTGQPTMENIERIMSAGAEVCLGKPLDEKRLVDIIGLTDSN